MASYWSKAGTCGRLRFRRSMCPSCQSFEVSWRKMSGGGGVVFVVPHPPLTPAFEPLAPYNVIVVELEEDPGIRMVGNLVPSGAERLIRSIRLRSGSELRSRWCFRMQAAE